MLHGNPTWSYYFRNLVVALRDRFRCIVPDHIGCGLSDKPQPPRYDYSLRSRVDDLTALLEHLGVREKVTLVLHDWGGIIGMAWAARHVSGDPAARHSQYGRIPSAAHQANSPSPLGLAANTDSAPG